MGTDDRKLSSHLKKLQAVFLLIDIRHEPSDNDIMMYDWMVNQGFAPIIIATKSDKLKKARLLHT